MPDRLNLRAQGVADANGNVSIVFGPPATGEVWIGSVGVTNSVATAYWSALVGGVLWGNAFGAGVAVVQAVEGEQIVLAATALTPNNTYSAALFGAKYDRTKEYVPWAAPVPQPVATAGVSLGFTGTGPGTGGGGTGGGGTAPPPPASATAYLATALGVTIGNPGGQLASSFLPGAQANVVSWTLSIPSGGANAWVQYGANGGLSVGIFLPSPSFLYEDTWLGSVFATSDGANISAGMQIIRRN